MTKPKTQSLATAHMMDGTHYGIQELLGLAEQLVVQYRADFIEAQRRAERVLERMQDFGEPPERVKAQRKDTYGSLFPRVRHRPDRPKAFDLQWVRIKHILRKGQPTPFEGSARSEYIQKGDKPGYPLTRFTKITTSWELELIERYEPVFTKIRRLVEIHVQQARLAHERAASVQYLRETCPTLHVSADYGAVDSH